MDHHEVELATGKVSFLSGGNGPNLLWLHHSWGNPGELAVHQQLTNSFTVIVPDMPGWGGSERPLWARTVRDIAILLTQFADQVCEGEYVLVGAGFGGYIAAEMACTNRRALKHLVLIGSAGLQPEDGEIKDQMMLSHRRYIEESFGSPEQYIEHFGEEPVPELRELWDQAREMTARVSWKPYMFNRRLGELLKNMTTPTELIWGEKDSVIPASVADQFAQILPQSTTHIIDGNGHLVEIENPDTVATIVESIK